MNKKRLIEVYIKQNNSREDTCKILNISEYKLQTILKKYNIKKSKQLAYELAKKSYINKYGVSNPSYCKEIIDKIANVKLKRYGNKGYINLEKQQQTNLKKYGNICALKNKNIKRKVKKSIKRKYGVDNVFKLQEIQQKAQNVKLEKYGDKYYNNHKQAKITNFNKYGNENYNASLIPLEVQNIFLNKESIKKYIENCPVKTTPFISQRLNVSTYYILEKLKKYNLTNMLDSISTYEKEINLLFPCFVKTRKLINKYEIDMYNEQKQFAIEFNGNYWHCDAKIEDSKYHYNKSLLCEKEGIFLFHIFEYEWLDSRKKPILVSMIKNNLNMIENKIYARKCIIKEIDIKECKEFLNINHLQGEDKSSIKLGLFYKEKLVSVMTFGKPRFNNKYKWELLRFANKINTNVVGGASKLFNFFIKKFKPKTIISYSNISKTKGKLYEILGFKLNNISKPNFVWIKGNEVLSRYQCQKHKLKNNENFTADQIMRNANYNKIYDCENKVWIWKNNT